MRTNKKFAEMKMLYLSESLYKENPLQVNRCRGDQILYGISVVAVMEAPFMIS